VVDVEIWVSFKTERAESVAAIGRSSAVDLAAQDGNNAVAIVADVDDPAAMMAALASPAEWPRPWSATGCSMVLTICVEA
jgi:hypothetical protein